jgi:hypothetical protein
LNLFHTKQLCPFGKSLHYLFIFLNHQSLLSYNLKGAGEKSHFTAIETTQFGFVFSFSCLQKNHLNLLIKICYSQSTLNFFIYKALFNLGRA